jgi:hypothetical protein
MNNGEYGQWRSRVVHELQQLDVADCHDVRVGKKYYRRCECFIMTQQMVCKCCGMQLRASPVRRVSREKFRARKKYDRENAAGRNNRDEP